MTQTINMKSNDVVEISGDGIFVANVEHATLPAELQSKVDSLHSALSAAGASEIHIEKDTWREFEHLIVAGEVFNNEFGTTFSSADFDATMSLASSFISDLNAQAEEESDSGGSGEPAST